MLPSPVRSQRSDTLNWRQTSFRIFSVTSRSPRSI
nr:MAG TPA: hypothetical protein [Caudoviricetes sp.]